MHQGHEHGQMSHDMMRSHYLLLALNLAISLAIMYFVMFAMIWSRGEFVQNINFFYMALMMWAPMGSLMLLTMPMMYRNRKLNMVLHAVFAAVFVLSTIGIREQEHRDRLFVVRIPPQHRLEQVARLLQISLHQRHAPRLGQHIAVIPP